MHLSPVGSLPAALALLLALSGCSSGDDRADRSSGDAKSSPSATTSTSPSASPVDDRQVAPGVYLEPDASYATYDGPGRLSGLQKALMREPGEHAGDDFELSAVVDAVRATHPRDGHALAQAIVDQVHGDYAKPAATLISFDPSIGVPDQPTEKLGRHRVVGNNHFAIVLDASGSMAAASGGSTRMTQAKQAIGSFVRDLPQGSTVSLRVYGQEGGSSRAQRARSCASSKVVYSGAPDGLGATLDQVTPKGWTPLAHAVKESRKDIPKDSSDAIVYVVTDGLETCGGDPVAATRALAGHGVHPVVNVIGFQLGDARTQQLRRMASAGHGTYTGADSAGELTDYWTRDVRRMMAAWQTWRTKALRTIEDQGQANMSVADTTGQQVMDGVDTEWQQEQQVLEAVKKGYDYDVGTDAWQELYARHHTLWQWGYTQKTQNWSKAYAQKTRSWSAAYHLGVDRWTTYYRQQH